MIEQDRACTEHSARPGTATRANAVRGPGVGGAADQRLVDLQRQSLRFAEGELGVKEVPPRSNRGPRVDEYARSAGMPNGSRKKGGEWCAYFVNFAYTNTAKANGGKFTGQKRLHSYQKNYAYFAYGSYTGKNRSAIRAKNEALRKQHEAQGSTRRYMAIEGSRGHRYAKTRKLPHEAYTDYRKLPIREGDTVLFRRGHVGMVKSYDPNTGKLVTVEGNVGSKVRQFEYDLSKQRVFDRFDGFGRPALGDLVPG